MEFFTSLTVVDMTILGALFIAFLIGWATGVIRFLTSFLSFLIAVAVAGRYSGVAMDWVNRIWDAQGRLERTLASRLHLPAEMAHPPAAPIGTEMATRLLGGVPLPSFYREKLAQSLADWSGTAGSQSAGQFLVAQIAASVLNALVFAALVIILSFLIGYLGRFVSEQVHAIPLVGTVDRLLGAAALVLQAALILSFITVWVVPALSMYGVAELGEAFGQATTPPYLVAFFEWIRGLLFSGGTRLWNA